MSLAFIHRFWVLFAAITLLISVWFPATTWVPSVAQVSSRTSEPSLQQIEQQICQVASLARGSMGVSAVEITTGRQISVNDDEPFPMASTYKVPIALQLLHQVSRGQKQVIAQVSRLIYDFFTSQT